MAYITASTRLQEWMEVDCLRGGHKQPNTQGQAGSLLIILTAQSHLQRYLHVPLG